jgi:hypothetical protein
MVFLKTDVCNIPPIIAENFRIGKREDDSSADK